MLDQNLVSSSKGVIIIKIHFPKAIRFKKKKNACESSCPPFYQDLDFYHESKYRHILGMINAFGTCPRSLKFKQKFPTPGPGTYDQTLLNFSRKTKFPQVIL